jgi:hypothetical protein
MSDLGPPLSSRERRRLIEERLARKWNRYSQASIDRLLELIDKRATYAQIIERTDFLDKHAIRNFLSNNGYENKVKRRIQVHSQELLGEVWVLLHQGLSTSKIAAKVNKTKGSIVGIIWRYDLRQMKERPDYFVCKYAKYRKLESPLGKHSPALAVQTATGSSKSSPLPGPVCSYRGVTLAHV